MHSLTVQELFEYLSAHPRARLLPSKVRRNWRLAEILHDHYVAGKSVDELACQRRVSASTIRTALRQGLHVLRAAAARAQPVDDLTAPVRHASCTERPAAAVHLTPAGASAQGSAEGFQMRWRPLLDPNSVR